MNIMSRVETSTGIVYVNIVLTEAETKELIDGKVVSNAFWSKPIKGENMSVRIVGYGDA